MSNSPLMTFLLPYSSIPWKGWHRGWKKYLKLCFKWVLLILQTYFDKITFATLFSKFSSQSSYFNSRVDARIFFSRKLDVSLNLVFLSIFKENERFFLYSLGNLGGFDGAQINLSASFMVYQITCYQTNFTFCMSC